MIGLPPQTRVKGVGRQQHMHQMTGGNTVDRVYLDFAKAISKVDH